MKFKALAWLFNFGFFLCIVVLGQGWSQDWVIPPSVKIKYPEKTEKKDWQDLQRDLQNILSNFKNGVENQYFQPDRKRAKPIAIAQMLENYKAVIVDDSKVYTTKEEFIILLNKYDPERYKITIMWKPKESSWMLVGGDEIGDGIDIIAVTKFEIQFSLRSEKSGDNGQEDRIVYDCITTSYHRKTTIWL